MSKSKTAIKNKKQTIEKDPQVPQILAFVVNILKYLQMLCKEIKDKIKIGNRIGKY